MPTEEFFNRDQITPADADQIQRFVESPEFVATNSGQVSFGTVAGTAEFLGTEAAVEIDIRDTVQAFGYEPVYVPIDVQALVVTEDGLSGDLVAQPFVDPLADDAAILPFSPSAAARAPGVHLHWALPDALLRGEMAEDESGDADLGLGPLPDYWVVLRLTVPKDATAADMTGFVVLSKDAKVIPLEDFTSPTQDAPSVAPPLQDGVLNAVSGGSLNWTATWEASLGRFSIHDPLTDIPTLETNQATYVVIGRWLDRDEDPLYAVDSALGFEDTLVDFGWKTTTPVSQFTGGVYTSPVLQFLVSQELEGDPAWASTDSLDELFGDDGRLLDQPLLRRKQSIFHGLVHGVPVKGSVTGDFRPPKSSVSVGFGATEDRTLAALTSDAGNVTDRTEQEAVETTLAAFTAQILDRLNTRDGLVDIEQSMHRSEFGSLPATDAIIDRYRVAESSFLPAGRHARGLQANAPLGVSASTSVRVARTRSVSAASGSGSVPAAATTRTAATAATTGSARAGDAARFGPADDRITSSVQSLVDQPLNLHAAEADEVLDARAVLDNRPDRLNLDALSGIPSSRNVSRPGPTFHQPLEPVVLLSGAGTSPRHGGDGRFSDDGRMLCRQAGELQVAYTGVLTESNVLLEFDLPYLPAAANGLVVEALMTSPFFVRWLSERADAGTDASEPVLARLQAEMAVRFSRNGTYLGKSQPPLPGGTLRPEVVNSPHLSVLTEDLLSESLLGGTEQDPVGVSVWAGQPWIPQWLEWEVEVNLTNSLDGWKLGAVDLEPNAKSEVQPSFDKTRTIRGRSLVNTRSGKTLSDAIAAWLDDESLRNQAGTGVNDGVISGADEDTLQRVMEATADMDLTSTTLSDLHEALLGLVGDGGEDPFILKDDDGKDIPIVPKGPPELLISSELKLTRARIIDCFGRTLDVPDGRTIPEADRPSDNRKVIVVPPRVLRPSRFNLELVGAGDQGTEPARARVDQIDADQQVNPVMGFLLHDHIDEALEVFDRDGNPLGQLAHDPFSGAVAWQVAPGRPLPPGAGPREGLESQPDSFYLGQFAAEMLATDAIQRQGLPRDAESESPLSAMLRAVDTTLWTVDTYAAAGAEHVAGLVGRPIAVVHAVLDLEVEDDLDELDLSDRATRTAREEAYDQLREVGVRVRLGELTREDDGLLGFFVDHDYRRLRLVDKVVASQAADGGRHRGHFGRYGFTPLLPASRPLENPYLFAEDELMLRFGQPRHITLLMLPAAKVHLTSGLLPRNFIQLSRDWVAPGLARIAPSVRVGPVLVDQEKVRLPLISSLAQSQLWTRRDTPTTWRDDPIQSATQTALLPDMPARLEEGYIRVNPDADPEDTTS